MAINYLWGVCDQRQLPAERAYFGSQFEGLQSFILGQAWDWVTCVQIGIPHLISGGTGNREQK